MPDGVCLNHPALVLSTERLFNIEDGMFYAVLISTKNHHPEYTLEIQQDWLNGSLSRKSYFVTHIVTFFKPNDVISANNEFVKKDYFSKVLYKVIDSMFDLEITEEDGSPAKVCV